MAGQLVQRGERSWYVRVFLGRDANGQRKFHNKTIHGTKKDAQKYLNAVLRELDLGTFVEPSAQSLSQYLEHWLQAAARPRVSTRTADGYEALLRRYVLPTLGLKKLSDIKALDIQAIYAGMLERELSARIVRHTHSALHNALKQAVKWGMLARNPAEWVELPKVPRVERRVLSPEEAIRFLEVAVTAPRGLIFTFALLSGMRPEEYLAVQWRDLDFTRGTITVQRALVRHKGTWSFDEPKTARSRRTIPLQSSLLQQLRQHKREQAAERLKAGSLWEAHDLIFCSEIGTPHSIPNLTYRYFCPLLQQAELPQIRLYDLRHSHATLLLFAEEHPKIVSERLGHSTITLTLDTYSHVLPNMQKCATERLETLLSGKVVTHQSLKGEM
jgi:integrase